MDPIYYAVIAGVLGLIAAASMAAYVMRQSEGSERMREISKAIKEGAMAFLSREYRILVIFIVVIAIALAFIPNLGGWVAFAFVFGSISSGLAGFVGMNIAIRANNRTASAAEASLNQGLRVAFRGGAVMGLCVVSIGIIGLSILYFAFHMDAEQFVIVIPGYGFGASLVAIFARAGGGIYTKAADTGADLVGKVEQGIPEDDPRNAAVIADFVGDNVGDVAGMGADLFESYVDSIIATITLATVAVTAGLVASEETAWFLPMMVATGGIVAALIGVFLVKVGDKPEMKALLNALRRGTFGASILTAIFAALTVYFLTGPDNPAWGVFWAILTGLIAGVLIGESTNYFTSYEFGPTRGVSEASQTGAGTNVTKGFAVGLMSAIPAIVIISIAIAVAYYFGDMYGIAIAGIGMLSTLGVTLATDAYGPVADNAGGIVEMSDLPPEIRERTDALDSLGNTTAATGKGFAIGAAALTALALMLSYANAVGINDDIIDGKLNAISLLDPAVIAGAFLGVMMPALFCALTLNAVGRASFAIINEVRRQFKEIKGIMTGEGKPEYGKCVDIATKAALKEMVLPGLLTVIIPIIVGFTLGKYALGGFLIGSVTSGFLIAVTMSNAGGAWDNAKKFIETGKFGGKGSDAHKAAVIGDTVGDPFKDTSGPSLNIMIKLMSIIALVLAPALVNMNGILD